MRVTALASESFVVEFADAEELQAEYEANISAGGLCLATDATLPEFTPVQLTLRMANGAEVTVAAMVVRVMAAALALALEGDPQAIREALTATVEMAVETAATAENEVEETAGETAATTARGELNAWDRVRGLTRVEKLLLAPKAERSERAVLLQDKDPQVVYVLLKNPRISTEEVLRIARSPLITAATVELIAKTTIWASNSEIRAALVHNARTPTPLALKLLPTLPEPEIRQIAKSNAVSQALKQAALRIVINRQ